MPSDRVKAPPGARGRSEADRDPRRLLYRLTHVDNVAVLAARGAVHAPACAPADDLVYRGIHDQSIRVRRGARPIPCGPGGTVDEYVSFYFCPRSPMLFRIQRDPSLRPPEGEDAIVYLVSSVERIQELALPFVFSDGHGLQAMTRWFDDIDQLDQLDWTAIGARYWRSDDDPDLARRKQAELLVHGQLPFEGLVGIACRTTSVLADVETKLGERRGDLHLASRPDWYY